MKEISIACLVLECNTCKELSDFGLDEIKEECLRCCKKSDEQIVTYKVSSALLIIIFTKVNSSLRNLKYAPENWADFPKYRPSLITTRKISKISK